MVSSTKTVKLSTFPALSVCPGFISGHEDYYQVVEELEIQMEKGKNKHIILARKETLLIKYSFFTNS